MTTIHRPVATSYYVDSFAEPQPQAGMGVASLVLAIISVVGIGVLVAVIVAAGATFHHAPGEDDPFSYLIGGWILAVGLLSIFGIVFGIGGIRQADRRHSIAVVGLCANIAIPLGLMFILLLAMSSQPAGEHHRHARTSRQYVPETPVEEESETSLPVKFAEYTSTTVGIWLCYFFISKRRERRAYSDAQIPFGATKCPTCYEPLAAGAHFCPSCGIAVDGV